MGVKFKTWKHGISFQKQAADSSSHHIWQHQKQRHVTRSKVIG
jgi:hypothetical protein